MIAYKYRSNILEKEIRKDTNSLLKNELFASSFSNLNDPFEKSFGLKNMSFDEKQSFLIDNNKYHSLGIYSLALPNEDKEFPNNELMWAHYANSHKGFCIEYDIDEIIKSQKDNVEIIKIIYSQNIPFIENDNSDREIKQKILGYKSSSWKYENEIRLIFNSIGKKQYSKNAIKAVYFGLNINLNERNSIISGIKNKTVKFYQMDKIDSTYKMRAILIEPKYKYQIMKERHNAIVENYDILYLSKNRDQNSLLDFVIKFRKGKRKPSNISIYDDNCILNLLGKYPIIGEEQELLAEHWIAYSTFDAPNSIMMYPEK